MRYIRHIIFILCFIFSSIEAQNLVPNSDFEQYQNCPLEKGAIYYPGSSIIHELYVKNWISPTPGSPDYFNVCNSKNFEISIPKNYLGNETPHSGNGFAGIVLYTEELPSCFECKEYLQVKLSEPLIKGNIYEVSMFISLADNSKYAVSEIGIVLSPDSIFNRASMTIAKYPQITNTSEEPMKTSNGWGKVAGKYIAKGGEQFITIGNFIPSFKTTIISTNKRKKFPMAYYFIDDVSVSLLESKTNDGLKENIALQDTTKDLHTNNLTKGDHIVLNNISFVAEKYELLPESYKELDQLVTFLKNNITVTIEIAGHSDNSGDSSLNQILSEKRAQSVYNYLIKNNISAQRLTYKGYGSGKPLADNATDIGRQKNRRVEFVILTK